MPRKPRIEALGGLYHVINRGNYRSAVFSTEGARKSFMLALDEACVKFGWELSAYCVMGNHFHLCVGTPLGNLSSGMRWLQGTFASRFNRFRKESGHLFQGRFKSIAVEPGRHWLDLVDYIHLNPVRAGIADVSTLGKYPWTSLYWFPKRKSRPAYLDCRWMDYSDEFADTRGGWRQYASRLRLKATDDPEEIERLDRQMCRGWCLGGEDFRKSLATEFSRDRSAVRLEREDLAKLDSDRWAAALDQCLGRIGKSLGDAAGSKCSADWKLAVALKLKRETSVTNRWLAERLAMGSPKGVSAFCGLYAREREGVCPYSAKLRKLNIVH